LLQNYSLAIEKIVDKEDQPTAKKVRIDSRRNTVDNNGSIFTNRTLIESINHDLKLPLKVKNQKNIIQKN
jgi:hypothetical protein